MKDLELARLALNLQYVAMWLVVLEIDQLVGAEVEDTSRAVALSNAVQDLADHSWWMPAAIATWSTLDNAAYRSVRRSVDAAVSRVFDRLRAHTLTELANEAVTEFVRDVRGAVDLTRVTWGLL